MPEPLMDNDTSQSDVGELLLSIVVCTYDRPEMLAGCLESLDRQTLDRSYYEIIVVDNLPGCATREVVDRLSPRGNIRYEAEPQQGLSHARNRGWRVAAGCYVVYLDDDCRVPEQWLTVAARIARDVSPAAFGGPYYPFYTTPKPAWYRDRYASHVQGNEARVLERDEYLDGGNLALRRLVLQRLGGFNAALGMSGRKTAYGEETQLIRRIRTDMPDELVYYDPDLSVRHWVHPGKMTLRGAARRVIAAGRYTQRVFCPCAAPKTGRIRTALQAIGAVMAVACVGVRGVLVRDRRQYPYVQNYWFERVLPKLHRFGRVLEQYRQCPPRVANRGELSNTATESTWHLGRRAEHHG